MRRKYNSPKIYHETVKIEDLRVGNQLFNKDLIIGVVYKTGKTLIHKHRFVKIRWEYVNVHGNTVSEFQVLYNYDCIETFNLIRFE